MIVGYSAKFVRLYNKLSEDMKILTEKSIDIFIKNQFDPRLKTHKLTGTLAGYFAFSVDYRHRVIFSYAGKDRILLHTVGDHSIYRGK